MFLQKESDMTTITVERGARPLVLRPFVAGDLVTTRPLVLDVLTPVRKAAALLRHHDLDEAPVVNVHDQPVGVVTAAACAEWEGYSRRVCPHANHEDCLDLSPLADVLVPSITLVRESAPYQDVVAALLDNPCARLYLIDDDGALVGTLDSADVLRRMVPEESRQLAS
jgi:CBS-domain-containing membrane protein